MSRLLKLSALKIRNLKSEFKRYLYDEIDWDERLIIIRGARGSGKTTLLLQKMKSSPDNSIYLSLDDFYFETNRLLLLLEELYEANFRHFFLDEVHQYQYWSQDLKNAYDNFPDIHIVATGSSVLKVNQGQADLSRRASLYLLKGLSFREFLELHHKQEFDVLELQDILDHHTQIASQITDKIQPLKLFNEYIKKGYYPFSVEKSRGYHQKLQQTVHLVLDIDIQAVEDVTYATVKSMKKLLYVISQLVPFTPNIQSLSEKIGVSRNLILKALDLLENAQILNLLRSDNSGITQLQKPEKIYLENPNLAYVFGVKPNIGNLRESFFFNQLQVKHLVTSSKFTDFMIDNKFSFEVGGVAKTNKQLAGIPLGYIASDGIEQGADNKIPLWLFGFLY